MHVLAIRPLKGDLAPGRLHVPGLHPAPAPGEPAVHATVPDGRTTPERNCGLNPPTSVGAKVEPRPAGHGRGGGICPQLWTAVFDADQLSVSAPPTSLARTSRASPVHVTLNVKLPTAPNAPSSSGFVRAHTFPAAHVGTFSSTTEPRYVPAHQCVLGRAAVLLCRRVLQAKLQPGQQPPPSASTRTCPARPRASGVPASTGTGELLALTRAPKADRIRVSSLCERRFAVSTSARSLWRHGRAASGGLALVVFFAGSTVALADSIKISVPTHGSYPHGKEFPVTLTGTASTAGSSVYIWSQSTACRTTEKAESNLGSTTFSVDLTNFGHDKVSGSFTYHESNTNDWREGMASINFCAYLTHQLPGPKNEPATDATTAHASLTYRIG
jgi:hypothetical protein